MAGTPGNRTQLPGHTGDNGFEGRGEHQPLNHSQIYFFFSLPDIFFLFLLALWPIQYPVINA